MEVALILKIAGIGMLIAVCCQILGKAGREDQATLLSIAGIVLVLFLLMQEISSLLATVRSVFGV